MASVAWLGYQKINTFTTSIKIQIFVVEGIDLDTA